MFLIFGARQFNKRLGVLKQQHSCPACNAVMHPHLLRTTTFITLFFIPLIPVYIKHYLVCANCSNPVPISFSSARQLEY